MIPSISSPENGESVVKRKITPLSDTQVLSPPSESRKRKRETTENDPEEFVPKKIDIEKELQSFITNPILDVLPHKDTHVKASDSAYSFVSPPLSDHSSMTSTLQSDPLPSSGTPSSSQSHDFVFSDSLSPSSVYLLRSIHHIVKENQALLNSLVNSSYHSLKDPELLQSQLEAEKTRSSQLTTYLTECMESNDALTKQVEVLQREMHRLQTADVEFSILDKGVKQTLEQNDEMIIAFQKQCAELKSQLEQAKLRIHRLQKQLESRESPEEDVEQVSLFPPIEMSEQAKTASSLQFMNQLLIQQLAEERKRSQSRTRADTVSLEKWKEAEGEIEALRQQVETLKRDNEELKQLLSNTDLTDYQLIEDSLEDSTVQ